MRSRAIADYHSLLAQDAAVSADTFEMLRTGMRLRHLVYGDRPIGVSLRPHLLDAWQFRGIARDAELVASALEKVAKLLIQNPDRLAGFGLTDAEIKLALVETGLSMAGITTRLDGFLDNDQIRFVEYNAENPSSLSDQEGLNRVLFDLPVMAKFTERYRVQQFSPPQALLDSLLSSYREWGGTGAPNVAILDWDHLPTSNEFVLLRNHFAGHGVRTIICSPVNLEYDGKKLRSGDFEIDLIYKRIIIHEFLGRYDDSHPLIRAYTDHRVCVINPFRCKIMHKKAVFELLTDETERRHLSAGEIDAISRSVPWTHRLSERRTTHHGKSVDLVDYVRRNRAGMVLKPNDDYGGHGVSLGTRLTDSEWEDAIARGLAGDYVVQEAVDLHLEEFPIFGEGEWRLQPMYVDTNPFLFRGKVCGAMVRLSVSPIVNVTSGGGETGFFVLDQEA